MDNGYTSNCNIYSYAKPWYTYMYWISDIIFSLVIHLKFLHFFFISHFWPQNKPALSRSFWIFYEIHHEHWIYCVVIDMANGINYNLTLARPFQKHSCNNLWLCDSRIYSQNSSSSIKLQNLNSALFWPILILRDALKIIPNIFGKIMLSLNTI